jgi:hypothetical protein
MYQQIMKGLCVIDSLDMTCSPAPCPTMSPPRSPRPGQFEFDERYWSEISYEAMDLVDKMLVVDPKRRITTEQVSPRSDSTASSLRADSPAPLDHGRGGAVRCQPQQIHLLEHEQERNDAQGRLVVAAQVEGASAWIKCWITHSNVNGSVKTRVCDWCFELK